MYMRIFPVLLIAVHCKECYWSNRDPYPYYGSITPYNDVRGDIRDALETPECDAVNVWAMFRHGNRHPGAQNIVLMKNSAKLKDDIMKTHNEGRGKLCAQDISDLKKWVWDKSIEDTPDFLTEIGYQEHVDLGERFGEKFHNLLEVMDEYLFRPSVEQRTVESAKAFTQGLGKEEFNFTVSEPMKEDETVRPYKMCPKYEDEVKNGEQLKREMEAFYQSKEFKKVTKHVKHRLGINRELHADNVTGLYELCRYYRSYSAIQRNPWCAVFSYQDLQVLEYGNDVRHYYRNGYGGAPITSKLGAFPLRDLYLKFSKLRSNQTRSFTGYFSHDTMLDMVYSALGLYQDYPEIAGFYRDDERKWRSSFLVPFAANFVAVLYRCCTEECSYKVKFFINEKEIPLCNSWECSWDDFVNKFQQFENVDMKFCHK